MEIKVDKNKIVDKKIQADMGPKIFMTTKEK